MLSYYRDINFAFSNWYVFKVQPGDRVPIVFPTVDLVPLGAAFAFGAKSMLASIRLVSQGPNHRKDVIQLHVNPLLNIVSVNTHFSNWLENVRSDGADTPHILRNIRSTVRGVSDPPPIGSRCISRLPVPGETFLS